MVSLSNEFCYATYKYHYLSLEEDNVTILQPLLLQRLPPFVTDCTQPEGSIRSITSQERFGLIPFRSPLLRECFRFMILCNLLCAQKRKTNILFLFLWVLRCFTSPGAPPIPMYSVWISMKLLILGFPIRISSDQRLFATSPKLFAGYYVLRRRVLSSHPPYALKLLYNHYHIESGHIFP